MSSDSRVDALRDELEALREEARRVEETSTEEAFAPSFRHFARATRRALEWPPLARFPSAKEFVLDTARRELTQLDQAVAEHEQRRWPTVVGAKAARLAWQIVIEIANELHVLPESVTTKTLHPARAALNAVAEELYRLANYQLERSAFLAIPRSPQAPALFTDWALAVIRGEWTDKLPMEAADAIKGAAAVPFSHAGLLLWLAREVDDAFAAAAEAGGDTAATLTGADERLAVKLPRLLKTVVREVAGITHPAEQLGD